MKGTLICTCTSVSFYPYHIFNRHFWDFGLSPERAQITTFPIHSTLARAELIPPYPSRSSALLGSIHGISQLPLAKNCVSPTWITTVNKITGFQWVMKNSRNLAQFSCGQQSRPCDSGKSSLCVFVKSENPFLAFVTLKPSS